MKILKYILFAVLGIIGVILVAAIFISGEMNYEKSVTINAPIDSVWMNVSTLGAMDKWSPFIDKDPNMKRTFSGTDGTVGAVSSWESETEGNGSQTIALIEAPTKLETDLKFLTPYESEAKGYVNLIPDGGGTKVTWGFKSEVPYPFNVMCPFMNMEALMGPDWSKGLGKLKTLCEKQ